MAWMGVGTRMPQKRSGGALAGAALLLTALALGGCSTSISEIPIGSAASDSRPKDTGTYLPVNDTPPPREEAAMDPAERAKVQKELIAARERQASAAAGKDQGQSKDQNQAQSGK
jgi:hypothetical protein